MKSALDAAKAVSADFSDAVRVDVHGAFQTQLSPVPEVKVAAPAPAPETDKVNARPSATVRLSDHHIVLIRH